MVTSLEFARKYGLPYDNESTSVNEKTTFERNNMILWDVPADINKAIQVIPNKIYCNNDLVHPLELAFYNVIEAKLTHEIITWDGCYNVRPMRGYEKQFLALFNAGKLEEAAKYLSIHSWGGAIDINAAWNQLNMVPTMSAGLVKCFTDAGLDWGGGWKRKDGMHYQLAKI